MEEGVGLQRIFTSIQRTRAVEQRKQADQNEFGQCVLAATEE